MGDTTRNGGDMTDTTLKHKVLEDVTDHLSGMVSHGEISESQKKGIVTALKSKIFGQAQTPTTGSSPVIDRLIQQVYAGGHYDSEGRWHDHELTEEQISRLEKETHVRRGGNLMGRDKLYQKVNKGITKKSDRVTKDQIMGWLRKQQLWQVSQVPHKDRTIAPVVSTSPGKMFQIDLIDFSKKTDTTHNRYIVVCIDTMTRYMFTKAIKEKTPTCVWGAMKGRGGILSKIKTRFGHHPSVIVTDAGGEFLGKKSGEFAPELQKRGIRHIVGTPGRPQGQGIVERSNRTLKNFILRALAVQHRAVGWVVFVNPSTHLYNTTYHRTIGMTPTEATQLTAPRVKELADRLKRRAVVKKLIPREELQPGDLVRVKVNKSRLAKVATHNFSMNVYVIVNKKIKIFRVGNEEKRVPATVATYNIAPYADRNNRTLIDPAIRWQDATPSHTKLAAERLLKIGAVGDTMSDIVRNTFKSPGEWHQIERAEKDALRGRKMTDAERRKQRKLLQETITRRSNKWGAPGNVSKEVLRSASQCTRQKTWKRNKKSTLRSSTKGPKNPPKKSRGS